ncbi:hypothetical protein GQX74_009226 [Glossina fuscipes]|nr:hypothetical protein GQX74_009226 [Glossina fuscipes]
MRSQSSPPILQEESLMIREGENSFAELGKKIGELIEVMVPTPSAPARRTIHQPMTDLVDMLAVLHKKAAKELGNKMPKKAVRDGTTQTEKGGRVNATKRFREEGSTETTPAKLSRHVILAVHINRSSLSTLCLPFLPTYLQPLDTRSESIEISSTSSCALYMLLVYQHKQEKIAVIINKNILNKTLILLFII